MTSEKTEMKIRPRRSALYMPGANRRALEKARTLSADCLILDLEDAVAPDAKTEARAQICTMLGDGGYGAREIVVRINAPDTIWGDADMAALGELPAAAQIIAGIKAVKRDVFYCCDPICGDHEKLYLPENVMHGLRDRLLPLADMATPNLFELQMLSGRDGFADEVEIIDAARDLGIAHMVVTSAPAPAGRIATLSIGADILRCETAKAPEAPYGMGDFFGALYLALHLNDDPKALGIACATLGQMAATNMETKSLPHGPVQMAAAAIQDKLNI